MVVATVVIPVSPQHRETGVYLDAQQSVMAQTIPTAHITVFDDSKRGAAATRNQGTAQVTTPFVVWLDADDVLRPTFVEECLKVYRRGTFVYTDWVLHGIVHNTPDCLHPFDIGQEHVITTLCPVVAWQAAGGFDETLNTLEDEAFYCQIAAYGWCGVRCPYPLVEYRRHLGHSLVNRDIIDETTQMKRVAEKHALFTARFQRYTHMAKDCGCGTPQPGNMAGVVGERQPNDVLAEALYSPQKQQGPITGRLYARTGLRRPLWVDVDDARSRPDLWRIVAENPDKVAPDVATVQRLVKEAIAREAATPEPEVIIEAPTPSPKHSRVKRRKAQRELA